MKNLLPLLSSLLICTAGYASQQEFDFTYSPNEAETSAFGVGALVSYDVAIQLNVPSLVGMQITGLSFDLPDNGMGKIDPMVTGWLSSKLQLSPIKTNMPDIDYTDVILKSTNGEYPTTVDVKFDTPYTITEKGVYAGYTVTVESLEGWSSAYPVVLASSENPAGGFYMHVYRTDGGSSKYTTWTDLSASRRAVSTMRVHLVGERSDYNARIAISENIIRCKAGEDSPVDVTLAITNEGAQKIENFTYTITDIDTDKLIGTYTHELKEPINNVLGTEGIAKSTLPTPENVGIQNLRYTVTKINGHDNENANPSAELSLRAFSWMPTRRPLCEEYTGLWCNGCPAGYVTFLQAADLYGEDFIGLAYHNNDALTTISPDFLPLKGAGAPNMRIDRTKATNDGFFETWEASRKSYSPADIDVRLYWDAKDNNKLRAEADLKFVEGLENHDYALSFVLVEDGMSDPSWLQRNNFFDDYSKTGKYWDLFVGTDWTVSGLVYDEVVLIAPDVFGIEGSIPESVEADKIYSYPVEFNLKDAVNAYVQSEHYGKNVIKNRNNLRVVGILLDTKTGEALNCNTSVYSGKAEVFVDDATGVELPTEALAVEKREYFSLDGVRLGSMSGRGAVIVVEHYSDGTVKTAKKLQ